MTTIDDKIQQMQKLPTITIKYGKLIDPFFKDSVKKNYPTYVFPPVEKVKEKVELFKKEWGKVGEDLLTTIYDITGFEFIRNQIDVFVITATPRDMSAPLIIRSRYTPEEFVDVMLHELLHVLFGDNKLEFLKLKESNTTLTHIQMFAVLTNLYKDVLKDEARLERVKTKADKNNPNYKRAWDIVEEIGYQKIIDGLK